LFLSSPSNTTNITNSVFIDNSANYGGAIRAQAISATNIRVENNQASVDGGGLYLFGNPAKEIVNSVVISNTADTAGGGIYVEGQIDISQTAVAYNDAADGGGIWTDGIDTFVSNSTISNNAAKNGGGVYIELTGAMTITNVTIAFSVSADQDVYKMGDLTLQNSIIYTPGTDSCLGSVSKPLVISLGDNLTDDNTCLGLTESGDEVNATVGLAPLADNGGGTLTHALLDGSPALDTANAAACAASPVNGVDQRGILRPLGAGCDKGAFERGAVVFLPILMK
jgi:predicted outer membrane repeat protein